MRGPGKGKTNNPAGKPAGTKNKVGAELKQRIADFLTDKFEDFSQLWDGLDDKDKARIYVDVIPFAVPKMASTAVSIDPEEVKKTVSDLFPDSITIKNGEPESPDA